MINKTAGLKFCGLFIAFFLALNCGGIHPKQDGILEPVIRAKKDFLDNYKFFVTKNEKKLLDNCRTTEEIIKFEENFWKIRDPDPNTPENECRLLIDGRIRDIKNEIFLRDVNTFGISFGHNGGLSGEMAQIYLLYGLPGYRIRLPSGKTYVEMMVWMYGDEKGHVLFRFLFHKKYGHFTLFKNHSPFVGEALKEIGNNNLLAPQYLQMIWDELSMNDTDGNFRAALIHFSYYPNITIGDALKPPDPAKTGSQYAVYNRMSEQTVNSASSKLPDDANSSKSQTQKSGQTQADDKMIFSRFRSLMPARFRIVAVNESGGSKISLDFTARFCDLDWIIREETVECRLNLEIDFKDGGTGTTKVFLSIADFSVSKEQTSRENFMLFAKVLLDTDYFKPLAEKINNELPAGSYIARIFMQNAVTGKYAVWQEQISK